MNRVEVKLPLNIDKAFEAVFQNQKNYEAHPAIEIFRLNNVFTTRSGLVLHKNKIHPASLLKDLDTKNLRHLKKYIWGNYFLRKKQYLKNTNYALIHNHWSDSYYHWIIEALTRLIVLEENISEEWTLLLPETYKGFQMETLKAFSIEKVHFIPQKQNLKVQKLILPEISYSFLFRKNLLQKLRKKLLKYASENYPNQRNSRKIYVSRAKAKLRKIQNEKELIKILENYSFEIIFSEELSFWEQVKLFQESKYFITPHGAGLVNMLFMPEKSKVMELAPPLIPIKTPPYQYFFPLYWYMSNALNLDYLYQVCNYAEIETQILEVDLKKFEKNLEIMFNQ